tara:strand:+ start:2232 stop:2555 length:324 start_codon:yes stop_codon:yes gene_type:complete
MEITLKEVENNLLKLKLKITKIEDQIQKKHDKIMQIKEEEGIGEWEDSKERIIIIKKLTQIIKEHIAGGNISAGLIGALVDHAHTLGKRKVIEEIDKEVFGINKEKV